MKWYAETMAAVKNICFNLIQSKNANIIGVDMNMDLM